MLTEGLIKALKAPEVASKLHGDGRGLGLLMTKHGTKSFCLDYAVARRRRRIVIGNWPETSLEEARAEASELRSRIKQSVKAKRDLALPCSIRWTSAGRRKRRSRQSLPKFSRLWTRSSTRGWSSATVATAALCARSGARSGGPDGLAKFGKKTWSK